MAEFYKGPTGRKRLLRTFEKTDPSHLSDLLYSHAVTVEDAMLQGGAVPGVDYNRLDLFKLAAALMPSGSDAAVTTGIPDSHPAAGLPVTGSDIHAEVLELIRQGGRVSHQKIAGVFTSRGKSAEAAAAAVDLCLQGLCDRQLVYHESRPGGYRTRGVWMYEVRQGGQHG